MDGLQGHVQVQKKEILKLKEKFQNIMHQKDEDVHDKDKTQATYKRLIQKLQQDAKRIITIVNSITTMEPCLSSTY
jgi:predicted metal-dependent hydrolase